MTDALNLFFSFSGRISLARFWLGTVALVVAYYAYFVAIGDIERDFLDRVNFYQTGGGLVLAASDLVILAGVVVSWRVLAAIAVKRLHDRGRSGWWALVFIGLTWVLTIADMLMLPPPGSSPTVTLATTAAFLIAIWGLIELGFARGAPGPNRYGPDPTGRQAIASSIPPQPLRLGAVGAFVARGLDWKAMLVIGLLLAAAIAVPLSANSPDAPFHLSDNTTILVGKYLCYALLALSIGLIWGYGGILSLGQGAFFALGGYAMGMYLMRQIGSRGVYGDPVLPDFMVFLNWSELPWFWYGFDQFWFAVLMIFLVPGTLAFLFGWFAFRSRVTGVYFSIITQALTYALGLLFFRNATAVGGNNGFTDFKDILGFNIQAPGTRAALFAASAIALALGYWICRSIIASKYGKVLVAVRDAESRTRFLGYRVDHYKVFVFTVSACLAAVAGALYVPQAGIINPGEFSPLKSIEAVIWVAVGGRGTLVGPILGGFLINALRTYVTGDESAPYWLIALLPGLGLLAYAWIRRREGLLRSPLVGAVIGAAIAALAFALPDDIAAWWGVGIAAVAALIWVIADSHPYAGGAVFGALLMTLLKTPGMELALAPNWPFFLGGLFILVTLLLPRGIVGTITYGWNAWRARRASMDAQEGRDADLTDPEPIKVPGQSVQPAEPGSALPGPMVGNLREADAKGA